MNRKNANTYLKYGTFLLFLLALIIANISSAVAVNMPIKFDTINGGRVYNALTDAYIYFKNNDVTRFEPPAMEIEFNDDDYRGNTSYQRGDELHIWKTHISFPHIHAHEYSHRISGNWGCLPYGNDPDYRVCGEIRRPRDDESLDENWANFGGCLTRNNNTLPFMLGGGKINDFWYWWPKSMAGVWWNLSDTDANDMINYNEQQNVNNIIAILKELTKPDYYPNREDKQNIRGFYEFYLHKKGITSSDIPSPNDFHYPNGSTKLECWEAKNITTIFERYGYSIRGWLPEHCTLNESVFTGNFYDYITDNNLSISVEINISIEGDYKLSSYIAECKECIEDVFTSNTSYLSPGIQNMTLVFDGLEIYKNKLNGSLQLLDLNLYNSSGVSLKYEGNNRRNLSDFRTVRNDIRKGGGRAEVLLIEVM